MKLTKTVLNRSSMLTLVVLLGGCMASNNSGNSGVFSPQGSQQTVAQNNVDITPMPVHVVPSMAETAVKNAGLTFEEPKVTEKTVAVKPTATPERAEEVIITEKQPRAESKAAEEAKIKQEQAARAKREAEQKARREAERKKAAEKEAKDSAGKKDDDKKAEAKKPEVKKVVEKPKEIVSRPVSTVRDNKNVVAKEIADAQNETENKVKEAEKAVAKAKAEAKAVAEKAEQKAKAAAKATAKKADEGGSPTEALFAEARKAIANKDLDKAASALERAHRIKPTDAKILFDIAQIRYAQGKYAQAESFSSKAANNSSSAALSKKAWTLLSKSRKAMGNNLGAKTAAKKAASY